MNDTSGELAAIRRELGDLRAGLQSLESRAHKQERAFWDDMSDRMRSEMDSEGRQGTVGVIRCAVYLNQSGGNSVTSSENVMGNVASLPSEEKLVDFCAALSHPLGLRAMYAMFRRTYSGAEMLMSKQDLVDTIGTNESELEEACRPLIANGTLRWTRDADGSDYYLLERTDLLPLLLSFL